MTYDNDIIDLLAKLIKQRRLLSEDIRAASMALARADAAIRRAWLIHRRLGLIRAATDPLSEPNES